MAGLVIPQGGYLDSLCNQGHHIFSGLTSVTVRKTFLEFKELDPDNDLSLDVFTRQTSEPTKTFSQLVSEQARTSHQKDCDLGDGLLQAFPYTRRTSEPTLARLVTEHANTFHRQYSERTTTDSLTTLETPSVEDCLTDQDDGILQTFPYMNSPVQSPSTANSCIITRDRATQVHDVDCDVSSTGHSMGLDCVHDCPPIHPPLQQPQVLRDTNPFRYCPSCGSQAELEHRFCPYCSYELQQIAASSTSSPAMQLPVALPRVEPCGQLMAPVASCPMPNLLGSIRCMQFVELPTAEIITALVQMQVKFGAYPPTTDTKQILTHGRLDHVARCGRVCPNHHRPKVASELKVTVGGAVAQAQQEPQDSIPRVVVRITR